MNEDGQVYFDREDCIPEADQKRYLESLKEEHEELLKRFAEAAKKEPGGPEDG